MGVKIATWNLEHPVEAWARAAIREKMSDVDADIWILTETHDDVEPPVTPSTQEHYTASRSAPRPKTEAGERWVTIWSRLPVLRQHTTSDPVRTAATTVELRDGTPLLVYGTVLPWRGDAWNDHPSKGAVAYKAALADQADDWRCLQAAFRDAALCVAGDFNQDLSDKHYYWSKAARTALADCLSTADLVALTGAESDPVAAASNGQKRCIDHICLSRALAGRARSEAWSPRIHERDVSDHYGVAITLS